MLKDKNGKILFKNDSTLHDLAVEIYEENLKDVTAQFSNRKPSDHEVKNQVMHMVWLTLEEDLSKTENDYEYLLRKFRDEFGDLMMQMWDKDMDFPKPAFMGEDARTFFNTLVYQYVHVHYEKFKKNAAEPAYSLMTEYIAVIWDSATLQYVSVGRAVENLCLCKDRMQEKFNKNLIPASYDRTTLRYKKRVVKVYESEWEDVE